MKKKAAGTGRRRMRVVAVAVEIGRRRMHVVVVAIGTGTGERRRSYGHCSFIYIIRVKDIFAISPYVQGAPAKMLGAPSNTLRWISALKMFGFFVFLVERCLGILVPK